MAWGAGLIGQVCLALLVLPGLWRKGYKIDIKSETQAIEAGDLPENYMEQMGLMDEEGYTGDYDEDYDDGGYDDYSEDDYSEAGSYEDNYDDYSEEEPEEIEFVETDK